MAQLVLKNISNAIYSTKSRLISNANHPIILQCNKMVLQNSVSFYTNVPKLEHLTKYSSNSHSEALSSKKRFENKNNNYKLPSTDERRDEKDLVQIDEPNSFGLMSRTHEIFSEKYEQDEGDKKEQEFLEYRPLSTQQLSTKQYADLIKGHIKNKRIKEALDVLEIKMLKEDRVKPESYIYGLAIGACAEVGYTKKAFKLFNDMKSRGLKVTGGIYTALFTACANSPWQSEGLQRTNALRNLMLEKGVEPNSTHYNAMIKAYGRCGDIQSAFQVVDEMCEKKIKIRVHTINFLLHSCISDKNAGFRHALIAWRKMLNRREQPNIYTFNLMLRCVKECGFGDHKIAIKSINEVLMNILPAPTSNPTRLLTSDLDTFGNSQAIVENKGITQIHQMDRNMEQCQTNVSVNRIPNFLSRDLSMEGVVSLGKIETSDDRFAMVGGTKGILDEMRWNNIIPDIKTITQILYVQPSTWEAEQDLLEFIKLNKIKSDINFYNVLIKKRCFRFKYEDARSVRQLIHLENKNRKKKRFWELKPLVQPDIITYGVLSLCCETKENAKELIEEMLENQLNINSEIMGAFLKTAAIKKDVDYVLYILETTKAYNISVNETFLSCLEKFDSRCRKLVKFEKETQKKDDFLESCKEFIKTSRMWIKEMNQLKQAEPDHPWEQFKMNQPQSPFAPEEVQPRRTYKRMKEPRKIPRYVP